MPWERNEIKMRKNKGITLISLAITVLVMAILATTVVYNGRNAVDNSKKQQFVSDLEMVQAKVNTISTKMMNNETEIQYYSSVGSTIDGLDQEKLATIFGRSPKSGDKYTTSGDGFRCLGTADLEKIGVVGIQQEILINFDTREVYSYTGMKLNGKMCYKLKDLGHTSWNVE